MTASRRSIISGIAQGLFRGLLVGFGLIGLGVLRALLVMLSGQSVTGPSMADVRPLAFYVVGFSLAGGFIGAFRPWLRLAAVRYTVFSVAGLIAVSSIVAGSDARIEWDRLTFMILTPIGVILGLFGVYAVERYFPNAGLWPATPSTRRSNERCN